MAEIKDVLNALSQSPLGKAKHISGIKDGEKALLVALKGRSVVLSSDFVEAVKLKRNLTSLGQKCEIISVGREVGIKNDDNLAAFASGLANFVSHKLSHLIFLPSSIVTKFDLQPFLHPIRVAVGQEIAPTKLAEELIQIGYERVGLVSSEGEFALRGDIFDIFPMGSETPIRCDFFDENIENIMFFNQNDMKNLEKIDNYLIFPSSLSVGENSVCDLCENVVADKIERLAPQIDLLLKSYSVMNEYDAKEYLHSDELKYTLAFSLSGGEDVRSEAEVSYLHNFADLASDLKIFDPEKQKVILFAGDENSKNRIKNFLLGQEISFYDFENSSFDEHGFFVSSFYFPNSFSFPELGIFAIGSDNLTKQKASVLSRAKKDAFYQPKIGEYVVHDFHGIGKCIKIERMSLAGCEKDYFVIEYRNGGMLYLPSEQASSLSAYIGEENPKMNTLGGREFEQMKAKVKEKLEGFALELMQAYKEREESKGYKFKSEPFLESAFANAFEFEETADQAQAISEVLADMESDKVMDRLLCGDVGFGKTEVAYRAAFKAVINNKQVAFLCPTTILSEQHFANAEKRMKDFGVKIEVLNRFKKPSEVKEILERLQKGEIDILIGTHKILSKNVVFKDLGLLIVDEEQRFGVADKEKIKAMKKNVDVLALSATPIPRTLHMSLAGIRDISVITTPPKDRLPIQTYVTSEDDDVVASVIRRELAREGKCFVIYNRVQSIDLVAGHIASLVPEAKIGVAHGQMNERALQNVIDKLFQGQYNVFVSTTLIENGIDLPSANSMIIFDADLLGLSQLYQLRGRIGRSDKLSYAYLLYKQGKLLTEESYKRLEAIKEFRELGSGFKISMRDLEIRGAGNVFGKEQHGHIEKVGYDMYVKLLNETIGQLQGKVKRETKPVKIELPVDAFIPENYVTVSEERIAYYVKISECSSRDDVRSVLQSLSEGFGDVPQSVVNLTKIALIKNLSEQFNIKTVKFDRDIKIELYKEENVVDARLVAVLAKFGASLRFENLPIIKIIKDRPLVKELDVLIEFLESAKSEKLGKSA